MIRRPPRSTLFPTRRSSDLILSAAALSFLGLGIQPPTAEWGSKISSARQFLRNAPYLTFFPGLAISVVVLALNIFGDGLRDSLDPKLRQ